MLAQQSHRRLLASGMGVAALLLLLAGCSQSTTTAPPGAEAAPLTAAGWLGGDAPGDLKGKVVVVDFWAYWCGPCKRAVPELIEAHKEYAPKGVLFYGITSEGDDALAETKAFIDETGIPWPNGYGADQTLEAYGIEYLPTLVVIGADGRIAWTNYEDRGITLHEALDRALRAGGAG